MAEELIALLEKAAANPKPAAPAPATGGGASPKRTGAAAGGSKAAAGGMPGMVGAGLMGMPDPYMMVSVLCSIGLLGWCVCCWIPCEGFMGMPDPYMMVSFFALS